MGLSFGAFEDEYMGVVELMENGPPQQPEQWRLWLIGRIERRAPVLRDPAEVAYIAQTIQDETQAGIPDTT